MGARQDEQIAINMINELLPGSFEDLIDMKMSMSPNNCIFRTPTILSCHNEEAYKPKAFSIGPFHYANKQRQYTQEIKLQYLQDLLSRSDNAKELYSQLDEAIRSVQGEARECYGGSFEPCDDKTFQNILLLDGCFIIELFRKDAGGSCNKNDPVFGNSILQQFLNHDLILLENQIPWLVLDRLFDLTKVCENDSSLIQIALEFFSNIFSSTTPDIQPEQFKGHQVKHILDLLRHSLLLPLGVNEQEPNVQHLVWQPLPSATILKESGIKFRGVPSTSILDVRFSNGVLEIPTLRIQETTETIFRNLISFEHCYRNCRPIITSYAILMDCLIDTTKDMEVLSEKCLFDNWVKLEAATKFFSNLFTNAFLKDFYYHELCELVNRHREHFWPRLCYCYMHYFTSRWAIIYQFFAAIIILKFLQTFLNH